MKLIDLRSDTVTKPDKNIIEEALQAKLGDDEYGEDPTVTVSYTHLTLPTTSAV